MHFPLIDKLMVQQNSIFPPKFIQTMIKTGYCITPDIPWVITGTF